MKVLLADLERKHPTVRASMLAALQNVVPSQRDLHFSRVRVPHPR